MPSAVIGLGLGWLLLESSRGEEHGSASSRYNRDFDRYETAGGTRTTGSTSRFAGSYGSGSYTGTTRFDSDFDTDYGTDFEGESGSEGRLSSAKHAVSGAAHNAKHAVSDAAHSAKDAVSGAAHNAKEKASDVADRARYRASELRGQARHKARQARVGFWEMMESNPLAMGAATLAVGVLAGLAIPSTRKEDELLGETRDHLVEDLKSRGQEVLEKGRQVAEATVDTVKQVAQDEGLTVEGVAEKVRTVGREAKNKVKEEVRNQDLVPGSGNQDQKAGQQNQAQDLGAKPKPEAGEFSGGTSNQGTGSGPSAVGSLGGSDLSGGLGGGSNTPAPTVGGVPGASMGSATGSTGRGPKAGASGLGDSAREESRVEDTEPELAKR
jgi:vacuolar-type H+-ATPase subunit H